MQHEYIITIALGFLPSVAWLSFYIKKDIHPEPKKWLVLVFLAGMAVTPIVILTEWQLTDYFKYLNSDFPDYFSSRLKDIAVVFIAIAAVEEFFKYIVVRLLMKHNPVFDEPEDAMIYMIVAALGFAAIENIIVMHSLSPVYFIDPVQPFHVLGMRFVGATFLHTLTSAIIGFYYAISLCKNEPCDKNPYPILAQGFIFSILIHGLFNYFIIILNNAPIIYISIPLMIILSFILYDFKILQGISPRKFNNK